MMHPQSELIAYLQGELEPAASARVENHLADCAECRREHEVFREILGGLRAAPSPLPDPHWGRYRAELRDKLDAPKARRSWLTRPLPLTLSTAVAGALVAVLWLVNPWEPARPDLTPVEEAVLGERLDLLREYRVVEQLDLLEDLDVIRQLDHLGEG